MNLTQFALVLSAMANVANERAEYYHSRNQGSGRPAPAAEAVAWTLRAILIAGATRCQQLVEEEERRNGE